MSSSWEGGASAALRACCALALCASAARAQGDEERAAAQALFDEARRLMAAGRHEQACPKLEESQRLDPGVGTQFNLAVCYETIGRTASAWSLFLEVAAAANRGAERAREQVARARAAALEPKLPRLRIVVPEQARASGLRVERGAVQVGPAQWGVALPTDPGTYTISASAPGKKRWQIAVTVESNPQTHTVTLVRLADAPAPKGAAGEPRSWFSALGTQRTVALGVGAGAVVALGAGGAFGLLALDAKSESDETCRDNACDAEGLRKRNDALAHGDRATVAMIAGGVLAAVAATLYLTGDGDAAAEERPLRPGALRVATATAGGEPAIALRGRF
jgi:serine/threonine-protein kinase